MATITVPKNIRPSGKVKVRETAHFVEQAIDNAARRGLTVIVLTELVNERTLPRRTAEFRIKWSLIQAIE